MTHASTFGARLWRNQVGMHRNPVGQWIQYGLANPGGSDLIGYLPVTITPDMVGQTVAVFLAIEVKTATGRLRESQEQFLTVVRSHGAIAGVARTLTDVEALLCPIRPSR